MNSCILMAEIVQDPQLRYTPDNQTPVTEMMVRFPGLRSDDPPATVKVVGWGNLAQDMQERYRQGDRVVIEGRLSMNTIERPEGFKEKRAELRAQRIYRLESDALWSTSTAAPTAATEPARSAAMPAAQPKRSSAATPAPARAAAPPPEPMADTDYDDIPF